MPKYLRLALLTLAVLFACLPIAFIATFLLSPFWSWMEATYGIESIGHSGPSDWCFYLIYCLMISIALTAFFAIRQRR